MKCFIFICGLFIVTFSNATEYYDMPMLKRMGCTCESTVQRDAFLTRVNNKVSRVLASDYRVQAGIIFANSSIIKSVLGSSSGLDVGTWVTTRKNYERPVVLINFGGF